MNKLFLKNIAIILLLFSCSNDYRDKPYNRETKSSINDIKYTLIDDNRKKRKKESNLTLDTKIRSYPALKTTKLITPPSPPKIGGDKKISFAVTDQVPLKDVLIEIGRVAKIDVDIDPSIEGGIIINAVNRPLKEVIDRIANLGNLRYNFDNGVLSFVKDTPFLKNYYVDYLIDGNLWTDVEANISAIIQGSNIANQNSEENQTQRSSYSSNKSAGIISIFATLKQHELIKNYLDAVEKTASAQVLIEAKIVEVELIDEYQAGIDWNLDGSNQDYSGGLDLISQGITTTSSSSFSVNSIFGTDINASISALEKFGTTSTLSSPRIIAMNNQLSQLNFSEKLLYFEIESSNITSTNENPNVSESLSSDLKEEEVGIKLEITPSINLKTREVVLKIKPTMIINSGADKVDPASPRNNGQIIEALKNTIPQVKSREIETVAKVQSGNVIIIGGLMQQMEKGADVGIPGLSRIPVIGKLFKLDSKSSQVVETVIFIKATIMGSGSAVGESDRKIEKMFDNTRRKFF